MEIIDTVNTPKKLTWHGPKQTFLIIYSGILMLISACLVGGTTNTIMPYISAAYGWDVEVLTILASIGTMGVPLVNKKRGRYAKD